ncbi:MAG: non-ribosomal peptide synthetase, partial [Tumebacillaceae bacterium]
MSNLDWPQVQDVELKRSYWKQQLKGTLPILQLPTDRPRLASLSYEGAIERYEFSQAVAEKLLAFSTEADAKPFMTMLAVYQILLSRYTGQEDLVVGTTRGDNQLLLRTDLSGEPSFAELLNRVRETVLGAEAHLDLPFAEVLENLQIDQELGYPVPFQTLLVFGEEAPEVTVAVDGLVPFDLRLVLVCGADFKLGLHIEYNTALFERATIDRLFGHFLTLLEAAMANAQTAIAQLPMLTEAETNQLLVEWNATEQDVAKDLSIHQLFEAQAARTPERVAVVFEAEQLTYGDLNSRANRLARHLQSVGVGQDSLVGIAVERSASMLVGLLAILKAGAAYVPLDPAYPEERLAYMMEDAELSVLLTEQALVDLLPKQQATVVLLDAEEAAFAAQSDENLALELDAENAAYVIYTSGSTGKPKGVQVPHRAVVNFLHSMRQQPGLTETDVLVSVTTLSF